MSENSDRPGVKQMFGRSRLPVFHREVKRSAAVQQRSNNRHAAIANIRGLSGGDVIDDDDVDEQPKQRQQQGDRAPMVDVAADSTEKQRERQRQLQEFKDSRARLRFAQLVNRPKPFYAGGSVTKMPRPVAASATSIGTPFSVASINSRPLPSGENRPPKIPALKRLIPTGTGIPIFGQQRVKPNLNVPQRVLRNPAVTFTLPPRPEVQQEDRPVDVCGGQNLEKTPSVALKDAFVFLPGATSTPRAFDGDHENAGPSRGGIVPWYDGLETEFTFAMELDQPESKSNDRDQVADKKCEQPAATREIESGAAITNNGQPSTSTKENKVAVQVASQKQRTVLDASTVQTVPKADVASSLAPDALVNESGRSESGQLRRSNRSTRFTGTFLDSPRRRSTLVEPVAVAPKPIPRPLDALDELTGPGIMEEEMPDFLVPTSANGSPSVAIESDLAGLTISTSISGETRPHVSTWSSLEATTDLDDFSLASEAASTGRPRTSTWTSIEISDDEEDGVKFATPMSRAAPQNTLDDTATSFITAPNGINSQATPGINETFTVEDEEAPPSPLPTQSHVAPRTPGSILRKTNAASVQKRVHFPAKFPSPIQFDVLSPHNDTPPDDVVTAFGRRKSAASKGDAEVGEDMIKW